jgi:CheY-like chemotaxis protein
MQARPEAVFQICKKIESQLKVLRGFARLSELPDMQAAGTKPAQKSWNLLLVEDNPADRLMLQSAFREVGIQCQWRVIDSGAEAVRFAEFSVEGPFDVIFLDWQLPGASGLEVLATMKRNSNWLSVPVIMLTGMQSPFHVNAARQAGAYDVLEKPMMLDGWLKIPARVESATFPALCAAA